jgi:hypothetical protein
MSTSKDFKLTRSIWLESGLGVVATLAIAAACGVPYLGLGAIDPHPVWLVVLVIAARYGTRGLAIVVPLAWGALAVAGGPAGPGRVLDTLALPIELGALAATVLVAWIASTNERRERARSPSWNAGFPPTPRRSAICAAPRSRSAPAPIASTCR